MKVTLTVKQTDDGYWGRVRGLPHCGVFLGENLSDLDWKARQGIQGWLSARDTDQYRNRGEFDRAVEV